MLAIGGLLAESLLESQNQVPLLGNIPIFGWLFKNKQKSKTETNLLILISTRIIEPTNERDLAKFNKKHFDQYRGNLAELEGAASRRDPIHKMYFGASGVEKFSEDFIFKNNEKRKKSGRGKMKEKMVQAQRNIEQKAAQQMAHAQSQPLQQFADGKLQALAAPQPQRVAYTPPPTPTALPADSKSTAITAPLAGLPVKTERVAHVAPLKPSPSNLSTVRSKKRSDLSLSSIVTAAPEQTAKGIA